MKDSTFVWIGLGLAAIGVGVVVAEMMHKPTLRGVQPNQPPLPPQPPNLNLPSPTPSPQAQPATPVPQNVLANLQFGALDANMPQDVATAVQQQLLMGNDPMTLRALATAMAASGFPNSASALNAKASALGG